MKNTLAYIKINRMDSLSEQELLEGGKNTLVFLGIAPDDNEDGAIEKIKAFSTECQNSGFNVMAETIFMGSGQQAVRFLKNIIGKIKYIDSGTLCRGNRFYEQRGRMLLYPQGGALASNTARQFHSL